MTGQALRFTDVTCARGGRVLWAGVSFALGPSDAALVTGPNGAGKSSLVRVAAGLLRAEGAVEVRGERALLTEMSALDGEPTLRAALGFWAAFDARPEPGRRVVRAIEALDLAPLAEVPVRLLSTGQRRRAALARVVASEAAVWLLDEPANGLDAGSVARLEGVIAAHRAAGGVALVATHLPIAVPGAVGVRLPSGSDLTGPPLPSSPAKAGTQQHGV